MHIEAVREIKQRFPDGTTSKQIRILFATEYKSGYKSCDKTVKISSVAKAVCTKLKAEALYQVRRAWREAAIDLGEDPNQIPRPVNEIQWAVKLLVKNAGE